MRERSAMLASVTFAFVLIAGLMLQSTLSADAEDCIAKPNAPAPQGEHWYYRIDHANNRQCWRLGPEGLRVRAEECAANREGDRAGSRSTAARAGARASPGDHRIVRCSCCKGRGRARAESCAQRSPLCRSSIRRECQTFRPPCSLRHSRNSSNGRKPPARSTRCRRRTIPRRQTSVTRQRPAPSQSRHGKLPRDLRLRLHRQQTWKLITRSLSS